MRVKEFSGQLGFFSDEGELIGRRMFLLFSSLWIFAIFCGWDVFQWLSKIHHYYGTFSAPPSTFSEQNAWLPLAYRVSQGNLFPNLPSIDPSASGLSFYPYLSLWFQGLMIALFGVQGSYFISHTILPLTSFFLLYSIFRKSLSGIWSIALSFVALISFVPLPFRVFLSEFFSGHLGESFRNLEPLEIAHFPFPSLSLPCFLLAFLFSIQKKKLTRKRLTSLTVVWALQSQIYILNALVGLIFWFSTFPLRLKRQAEERILGTVVLQALVTLVFVFPTLIGYLHSFQGEGLRLLNLDVVTAKDGFGVSTFYFVSYFIIPPVATYLAYTLFRIDRYEFFYRFWPVLVLLCTELSFAISNSILGYSLDPALAFSRLGIFFLHFYYLVPLIYFLSVKLPVLRVRNESSLFRRVRVGLDWLMNSASKVYLPGIMVLLSVFALLSMKNGFQHRKLVEEPALTLAWKRLDVLKSHAKPNEGVVADDPAVNLLLPIASEFSSLWVSRFSNQVPLNEVIERLALYARIFNWSEEKFIRFMSPGKLQEVERRDTLISLEDEAVPTAGVGYWLAMHKARLNNSESGPKGRLMEAEYLDIVKKIFSEIEVGTALKKFGIRLILSKSGISNLIQTRLIETTALGTLYEVESK